MFNNMRIVANIDVVGLFLCPTTNEDLCPLLAIPDFVTQKMSIL